MQIRITIILFLCLSLSATVQNASAQQPVDEPILRKATAEFDGLRYASAIKELEKVLAKEPDNERAIEMLAASNRNIKNYDEAVYWYGELTKHKQLKPEWILNYAEALANKQRYEESEQWYRRYQALKPTERRANYLSKVDIAALSRNAGEYKVSYTNINTDAAEFSPMYYKDGLMFISNRKPNSRYTFEWDQTPYTDIYLIDHLSDVTSATPVNADSLKDAQAKSKKVKVEDDSPTSLMSLFGKKKDKNPAVAEEGVEAYPLKGKIQSSYHEGPTALLPEGSLMFTRNNYNGGVARKSSTGINKLKMYTATGTYWEKIENFPYNNDEYSTGHPTISADGRILIYVSDMPRGYGGTDLYYCVRTAEGKPWSRPVNLGPKINTEGDEEFPYLDKQGKLYFSSNGFAGFGGLDIFEVVLKDMKPMTAPRNLGADINSSSDDFGFIKSDDGKTGFFSSNRRGNDDIYQYVHQVYNVALKGVVIDSKTNMPVTGSRVLLRHGGITDTIQTDSRGTFTRPLAKVTDYDLSANKLAYSGDEIFITTNGISVDSTINVVLKLNSAGGAGGVQKWVNTNCDSLKRVFSVNNIYFDLDKSFIRADAVPTMERLATIMKQHPEITINTASHTDSRASETYNRELSLRRGEAAKAYLVEKGIDAKRIDVKYYGKSRLVVCPEGKVCSEADQQLNRRTEFEFLLNGVNITQLNCGDLK